MPIYVRPFFHLYSSICLSRYGKVMWRRMATFTRLEDEDLKVQHSEFISKATSKNRWNNGSGSSINGEWEVMPKEDWPSRDQGRIVPTSSHLMKLIIPLSAISSSPQDSLHTVFLLHPSQPLSHIARLIGSYITSDAPKFSFRSISHEDSSGDGEVEWSDSTDIGNFIKSAVAHEHFIISISRPSSAHDNNKPSTQSVQEREQNDDSHPSSGLGEIQRKIVVQVPSFKDRTQFLRRRLRSIEIELKDMEKLRAQCDQEAHRGARRMAMGGFGALIVYWLGVARLTFYDFGWDVMEPITYLSGLSTVICGYLWFLYKGREVSYTSVLSQSVSTRRVALYKAHGFNIERWADLLTEKKFIQQEMNKIAEDYDVQWDGNWKIDDSVYKRDTEEQPEEERLKQIEKERIKENIVKPDVMPTQSHGSRDEAPGEKAKIDEMAKITGEEQEHRS